MTNWAKLYLILLSFISDDFKHLANIEDIKIPNIVTSIETWHNTYDCPWQMPFFLYLIEHTICHMFKYNNGTPVLVQMLLSRSHVTNPFTWSHLVHMWPSSLQETSPFTHHSFTYDHTTTPCSHDHITFTLDQTPFIRGRQVHTTTNSFLCDQPVHKITPSFTCDHPIRIRSPYSHGPFTH